MEGFFGEGDRGIKFAGAAAQVFLSHSVHFLADSFNLVWVGNFFVVAPESFVFGVNGGAEIFFDGGAVIHVEADNRVADKFGAAAGDVGKEIFGGLAFVGGELEANFFIPAVESCLEINFADRNFGGGRASVSKNGADLRNKSVVAVGVGKIVDDTFAQGLEAGKGGDEFFAGVACLQIPVENFLVGIVFVENFKGERNGEFSGDGGNEIGGRTGFAVQAEFEISGVVHCLRETFGADAGCLKIFIELELEENLRRVKVDIFAHFGLLDTEVADEIGFNFLFGVGFA